MFGLFGKEIIIYRRGRLDICRGNLGLTNPTKMGHDGWSGAHCAAPSPASGLNTLRGPKTVKAPAYQDRPQRKRLRKSENISSERRGSLRANRSAPVPPPLRGRARLIVRGPPEKSPRENAGPRRARLSRDNYSEAGRRGGI